MSDFEDLDFDLEGQSPIKSKTPAQAKTPASVSGSSAGPRHVRIFFSNLRLDLNELKKFR
jgi:hypothetical protein